MLEKKVCIRTPDEHFAIFMDCIANNISAFMRHSISSQLGIDTTRPDYIDLWTSSLMKTVNCESVYGLPSTFFLIKYTELNSWIFSSNLDRNLRSWDLSLPNFFFFPQRTCNLSVWLRKPNSTMYADGDCYSWFRFLPSPFSMQLWRSFKLYTVLLMS